MKNEIVKLLKKLEKEYNISILFAVENGSRAWGMDSQDSDYDIRFVFYRPLEEYITLNKPEDVITAAFDEKFQPHEVRDSLIDMCGFDIFKYLKLLASSNPTTIEWLNTPIVYLGDNNIELKSYINNNFSRKKLFYHYFSMAKSNYKLYIVEGKQITYKKYLYSMRGMLNAEYVYVFDKIPPLKLEDTLAELSALLPDNVVSGLKEVIGLKSQGFEKETVLSIPVFDAFLKSEFDKTYTFVDKQGVNWRLFDKFLQNCLGVKTSDISPAKCGNID